jgi:lipopolysaccharide assembly protein A
MQTLKIIILVFLALFAGLTARLNWGGVNFIMLGQKEAATIPLGLLLIGAFLIGLVPAMIWYKLSRWTVRRKLTKTEAKLQAASTPAPAPPPVDAEAALLARARAAGGTFDGA